MTERTSADPEAWDDGESRVHSRQACLQETYLELSRAVAARAHGLGPLLARTLTSLAEAGPWSRVECKWFDAGEGSEGSGAMEDWRARALGRGQVFGWSHPDESQDQSALAVPMHGSSGYGGVLLIYDEPGLRVTGSEARWLLETGTLLAALRTSEGADPARTREGREASRRQLGVMAGGIAHDLNNLLVGIRGGLELAFSRTDAGSALHQELELIDASAQRAAALGRSLMAYSGGFQGDPQPVELNRWVRDVATRELRELSGREPRFEFESPTLELTTDPSLVERILAHLISNAVRAHGETAPEVTVRTGRLEALEPFDRGEPVEAGEDGGADVHDDWILFPAPSPRSHAYVEVTDLGEGIPRDLRHRIFDPCYTCHSGRSGLGLAAVLGMVEALSGGIQLTSTLGQGTSVRVVLPDGPGRLPGDRLPASLPHERGLALVVDDDPAVLNTLPRLLERQGFRSRIAPDARGAIEILAQGSPPVEVVLLDIEMPGMDGIEALRELRARWPNLPVVLISGYSDRTGLAAREGVPLLRKPFDGAELGRVLPRGDREDRP